MEHNYFYILFSLLILSIFSLFEVEGPYTYTIVLLMLFFPFVDSKWKKPDLSLRKISISVCLVYILIIILLVLNLEKWQLIISSLLLAALPEEWFFRGYFLVRIKQILKSSWQANTLTSLAFSLLHLPTQGWFGLSVFFPSLLFGWLYLKTNNLFLVIGIHALSNTIFLLYLNNLI